MDHAAGPVLRIVAVNDVYSLEQLPRLANLIRHHAASDPPDALIAVIAGDFVGPSMLSSLDKGRAMIECLNAVGITHAIFGNHEDDIDVESLRARVREFRGTWLATNMPGFEPQLPSHQVIEIGGARGKRRVRVGLLGVVMEDASIYRRPPFGGAPVEPANATAMRETTRLLREEGCSSVVPMTHQNVDDDRRLARAQREPPYPVIIGGHEHEVFLEQIDGTWLVKAGMDAIHAAIVDLTWPADLVRDGAFDQPAARVVLDDTANYPEDESIRALVDRHMHAVHELERATLLAIPAGTTLSSVGTRVQQTSLGELICSRMRDALEADACMFNGGGIRAKREYQSRFTYGDLEAEVPFDNEMVVVPMRGRVVADSVAASRAHAPAESGGFLQVDDGMTVDAAHRVTHIAHAPLDPERVYRVAVMRNLLTGMDHIEPLAAFGREHPDLVPAPGSGRGVKLVLVDAFSKELWRQLGSFESIDANRDGVVSRGELADAVQRVTGAEASPVTVDLVMRSLDTDHDRVITREEADRVNKR
jgi:2',3'-cyclic-nucleotide 2'-phosphodiesterase (5'-nucleotidase family)